MNRLFWRQPYLFLGLSVVLVILIVAVGIPLLLAMAGTISNMRQKNVIINNDQGPVPNAPRLFKDVVATKSASFSVAGLADTGVTVEIFQNDASVANLVVTETGQFLAPVVLTPGKNIFIAKALLGKQTSDWSENYVVIYSIKEPRLEIKSPSSNATTNQKQITISGTTEPENTVSLNDRFVIVGNSGTFSYLYSLNEGENKIKVTAVDPAGNQKTQELIVKYQK